MDQVQNLLHSARHADRLQKPTDATTDEKKSKKGQKERVMVSISAAQRRALSRPDVCPTEEEKKQIAGSRKARLAELTRIRKQKDEIQKQKSNRRSGPHRR